MTSSVHSRCLLREELTRALRRSSTLGRSLSLANGGVANGRCLRSCLARSSRWAFCKPVPGRPLQTLHQICTSSLCVWNSFHCLRGVHCRVRREEMFIGFRSLAKPYATDKSSVLSTLSDPSRILPLGDTTTRNSAASSNFITSPWYGFPQQSSNAVFLLPFT